MVDVTHIAFLRVGQGLTPEPPVLQEVGPVVDGFIGGHAETFIEQVTKETARPRGQFIDGDANARFRSLLVGTDLEFLDSMNTLGKQLIGKMDGRTSEGLLLALRAESPEHGRVAGLLKLKVDDDDGAVLKLLESGEYELSTVTGMLEKPGRVQKGALITSGIQDGEVYCGDNIPAGSMYFPRALGFRVHEKPAAAVKAFCQAVHDHAPDAVRPIAAQLDSIEPAPTRQILAEFGELVPELTLDAREAVYQTLMSQDRPVSFVDPSKDVHVVYQVGRIKVRGPMSEVHRLLRVVKDPERGWQIVIDADERPEPTYR